MVFLGCEKCGVADNRSAFKPTTGGHGGPVFRCPECGRPMTEVNLQDALELVRERAEAKQWRAAARPSNGTTAGASTHE